MAKRKITPSDALDRHSRAQQADTVSSGSTLPEVKRFPTHIPVSQIKKKPEIIVELSVGNLRKDPLLEYDNGKGKREFEPKPPLKEHLLKDQKLQALFEFLVAAPAKVLDAQVELARKQGATFPFSQSAADASEVATPSPAPPSRPADAPPLWAERTTGRKVSPVGWIKMHYGNKDPDNWDPMGMTRKDLLCDRPLYDAYAKWIASHDHEDLGLPSELRRKVADPAASLSRHREASLRSYHKRRSS